MTGYSLFTLEDATNGICVSRDNYGIGACDPESCASCNEIYCEECNDGYSLITIPGCVGGYCKLLDEELYDKFLSGGGECL